MPARDDDLEQCRRELFRLLIENAALRYAATSFGDLAERLNSIVSRHRRLERLPASSQRAADDPVTTPSEGGCDA